MSDILKKVKQRKEDKQGPAVEPQEHIPQPPAEKAISKPAPDLSKEAKLSEVITSARMKEVRMASEKEANKIYIETLSLIREMLKDKELDYRSIDIKRTTQQIEKMFDQLQLQNDSLIELSLVSEQPDGARNYLYQHLVNTSILSMITGISLGYDRPRLIKLGISSLLFDIALAKRQEITGQSGKLSGEEYNEIKNHAKEAGEILEEIEGLPKVVVDAVYQHHERVDGSGYPQGLQKENIKEFAQIIGLADMYEALTHKRPHRPGYNPFEAMKVVLNNKNIFNSKITKAFLEKVGLYPVGSIVNLSTNEQAKVIKHNLKHPLSPKVLVISESEDEGAVGKREVDLSSTPTVHIISCLSCEHISIG
jgi:HD-GYP domain-containing protein (c-di-GMP phosphodiesterase class II)